MQQRWRLKHCGISCDTKDYIMSRMLYVLQHVVMQPMFAIQPKAKILSERQVVACIGTVYCSSCMAATLTSSGAGAGLHVLACHHLFEANQSKPLPCFGCHADKWTWELPC